MSNIISLKSNKTDEQVKREKYEHRINSIDIWTSYFRNNPHRFCEEFLNVTLKLFQKIILWEMAMSTNFVYIASRGSGKSYLIALFSLWKCILYPGSRIAVCSVTMKQSINVLKKITEDFMVTHGYGSILLNNEIKDVKMGKETYIEFKNGSIIFAVSATESSRSYRANILIMDEFVQMNKRIIDTVLEPFLTSPRRPGYLDRKEYRDYQVEENARYWLSSAWYKDTWSYRTTTDATLKMLQNQKSFAVAIPYQASIKEGIILKQKIIDELSKPDFNEITFQMEYCGIFWGDTGEEFFAYDDIAKQRVLENAYPPIEIVMNGKIKVDAPDFRCKRLLSVDVALMQSTKKKRNDASSFMINDLKITSDNKYISNFTMMKNYEGLTADELILFIFRYYYYYKCDYIVIDANGIGMPIVDGLMKDVVDPETGQVYNALSCFNDSDIANRCRVPGASKVIWSIKVTKSDFNSTIAKTLRNSFKQGTINLLIDEYAAENILNEDSKYNAMGLSNQTRMKMPYLETTLAVNELVRLDYEINGSNVRIKERSGARKDRYSSMAYSVWVSKELERNIRISPQDSGFIDFVRKPKRGLSIYD